MKPHSRKKGFGRLFLKRITRRTFQTQEFGGTVGLGSLLERGGGDFQVGINSMVIGIHSCGAGCIQSMSTDKKVGLDKFLSYNFQITSEAYVSKKGHLKQLVIDSLWY